MANPYNTDLDKNPANYQPLTPLSFLARTASVFPEHTAIIHGSLKRNYAEFYQRSRQLASSLKKEGIELDLSKGKDGGRDFGEKVGLNMINFCPKALMLLADNDLEDNVNSKEVMFSIVGELKSISGDEISVVSLKDENGKTQKFLWLNNFEGSDRLIISKNIKNLKVKVSYTTIELYSPKLKEYIVRKQISKIEYLD